MPAEGPHPQHRAAGVLAAGDAALDARGGILLPARTPAAVAGIGRVFWLSALRRDGRRANLPPWPRGCRPRRTRSACWLPATARSPARQSRSTRRFSRPVRLELAAAPIDAVDVFLYHKTTHRAVYAAAEAGCHDGDDVLLYNQRGEVTETTRGNIVVRCGGDFWTPPVSCGLLPGAYRAAFCPKARSASRRSHWLSCAAATNSSLSIPCGIGGRRGLWVRVTLDHLP